MAPVQAQGRAEQAAIAAAVQQRQNHQKGDMHPQEGKKYHGCGERLIRPGHDAAWDLSDLFEPQDQPDGDQGEDHADQHKAQKGAPDLRALLRGGPERGIGPDHGELLFGDAALTG